MSKKSTVTMSFAQPGQQQQQQPQQQTTTQVVETTGPNQQQRQTVTKVTTTTVQQQQQPVQVQQQQVQQQQQQKRTRPQVEPPAASQRQQSSGKFAHIKDNLDSFQRLDSAVANMSLRAPKAGDQFDNERRLEKRYDDEEKLGTPQRVLDWVSKSLHGQVPPPNNSHEWKEIQLYLRDGTILCKLMNKLLKNANMDPVGYRPRVNSAFVALNNLDCFMIGAKKYGVPVSSLFQPSDLYEGRKGQLTNVLHCLNALGCVANARGFQPPFAEPAPPKADWCKDECYD